MRTRPENITKEIVAGDTKYYQDDKGRWTMTIEACDLYYEPVYESDVINYCRKQSNGKDLIKKNFPMVLDREIMARS